MGVAVVTMVIAAMAVVVGVVVAVVVAVAFVATFSAALCGERMDKEDYIETAHFLKARKFFFAGHGSRSMQSSDWQPGCLSWQAGGSKQDRRWLGLHGRSIGWSKAASLGILGRVCRHASQ